MKNNPVMPPTYLLIAIAMMVALHLIFPAATIVGMLWSFVGVIPLAAGVILNLVADRNFKKYPAALYASKLCGAMPQRTTSTALYFRPLSLKHSPCGGPRTWPDGRKRGADR